MPAMFKSTKAKSKDANPTSAASQASIEAKVRSSAMPRRCCFLRQPHAIIESSSMTRTRKPGADAATGPAWRGGLTRLQAPPGAAPLTRLGFRLGRRGNDRDQEGPRALLQCEW